MPDKRPRKILVAILDNLGDAVMGTALFEPLRRAYPGVSLGFWVKEYAAGVFDLGDSVRLHAADPFWDKAPGRSKGAIAPFLETLREIRSERYDLVFILNSDWKRALACRLAGIPGRVGYARRNSSPFLTRAVPDARGNGHVIERHLALLAADTGSEPPPPPFRTGIGISEAQRAQGRAWRKKAGWEKNRLVVLHLITGDEKKNWPLERWARLIRAAAERWKDLRFTALAAPREEPALREAFKGVSQERLTVFTGSIPEIKPILAEADLFIGGDSGPGHMAGALGRPVVSLFGPTDPAEFKPAGPAVRVLHRDPLQDLPEIEVLHAAAALLPAA